MSQQTPEVMDHLYDGIQEYDNPLPGWWKWLFIGSIIFSIGYWLYYQTDTPGRSSMEEYNREMAEDLRRRFSEIGTLTADRATILKYMNDPKWRVVGEMVFKANCVSCHGDKGEGRVGPNLCDDHWKNVKVIEDIAVVVSGGANNQAMPAWKNRLHPNELALVCSYVASLRGTNPPNAKPAEGNKIDPWK